MIGCRIRCNHTGVEGIVSAIRYDNKHRTEVWFGNIKHFVSDVTILAEPVDKMLGRRIKCNVTGIEGVVTDIKYNNKCGTEAWLYNNGITVRIYITDIRILAEPIIPSKKFLTGDVTSVLYNYKGEIKTTSSKNRLVVTISR